MTVRKIVTGWNKSDQTSYRERVFLPFSKILIESRAFNKEEFNKIVDKLLILCQGEERRGVKDAINNERFHYLELQHGKALIDDIWKLRQTITNQQIIEIDYQRADKKIKQHKVKPVGIVFSEFILPIGVSNGCND